MCCRSVIKLFIVLFYLFITSVGIQNTQPNEDNLEGMMGKINQTELSTPSPSPPSSLPASIIEEFCPSGFICSNLSAECLKCDFNYTCVYGAKVNVTCKPIENVQCEGARIFERSMICRYCYQTDHWEHTCIQRANCNTVAAPKVYYPSNCTVRSDILCLGRRTFNKNLPCNWSSGYRWSTALILSVTLGGFGADRFYLGHWQEGIGKVFSFGGLGVWTLIDVILISLRYLGPADGSLYI